MLLLLTKAKEDRTLRRPPLLFCILQHFETPGLQSLCFWVQNPFVLDATTVGLRESRRLNVLPGSRRTVGL